MLRSLLRIHMHLVDVQLETLNHMIHILHLLGIGSIEKCVSDYTSRRNLLQQTWKKFAFTYTPFI